MIALWSNLVDALRAELQQYGELLALLDLQHQAVTGRGPEAVLESVAAVRAQSAAVEAAVQARQQWQEQLAAALNLEGEPAFARLMAEAPPCWRPLVAALVEENNDLRVRVRASAERNQGLLRHSLELLQRGLTALEPARSNGEPDAALESHPDCALQEAAA